MKFSNYFKFVIICGFLAPSKGLTNWSLFNSEKKVTLKCDNVKDIEKGFLIAHITKNKMNSEFQSRVIKKYIESLDPSHLSLSQKDVNILTKKLKGFFKKLEQGDCQPILDSYKYFISKLKQRVQFAKKKLKGKFKFNDKVKIVLDPEKRGYAPSQKSLYKLQEKYIHFQISNRLITGKKINEAIRLVQRSYDRLLRKVKKLEDRDILSNYLISYAQVFDPHTLYFSDNMLEDFEIRMRLSLEGIGATLVSDDGFTVIDSLVEDGAAGKSGELFPKDKIIEVAQFKGDKRQAFENVVEWDLEDVVRLIRGKKGSKVALKILRRAKGKNETKIVTLVRSKVKLKDEAARITYLNRGVNGVKRRIGIIFLPSFYSGSRKGDRSSATDVKYLIKEAREKKVDGLLLDVSGNGGGSLTDAVRLAGLFFKTGNVVKQSSRSSKIKPIPLKDKDEEVDWSGPLVILTSRVSASASEIVAGALKDYKRAVIVGSDHTFGKGTVQQVVELAKGLGAIKVTVGMFFTPGGFSTQHRGVSSHIVLPSPLDGKEIGEKTLDYSLPPQKIDPFLSPEAFVAKGTGYWKSITKDTLATLSKRSQTRVGQSKEFKKIIEEAKKSKEEEDKPLILGESFQERKDKNEKYEKQRKSSKKEKLAEYHDRPELKEAIRVLIDLIDIESKVPLKVAKAPKDKV